MFLVLLLILGLTAGAGRASAYDGVPKLIVIIVIDQFRGDYLHRIEGALGQGGFRLFTQGAWFDNCQYDYANTETAPGHATIATGAYSNGHGIFANQVWDDDAGAWVTSVADSSVKALGVPGSPPSASPKNLLSDTLGDELKLATHNQSRVYTLSLKDRAAILTGGFSADGVYWIDQASGAWITSTFYTKELPAWVQQFNAAGVERYWDKDWKDASGKVLQRTTRKPGARFYDVIGGTGLGNEYEFEFARALVSNTGLGTGPATDVLVISLSPNDILGHRVGPDDPQMQAMWLEMDRQIASFLSFVGQRVGTANVWGVLTGDHGVAPVSEQVLEKNRIPGKRVDVPSLIAKLNVAISKRLGQPASEFVHADDYDFQHVFLSREQFKKMSEADAEHIVGEELLKLGYAAYYAKSDIRLGLLPSDALGRRISHSYSPAGGWWILSLQPPFALPGNSGTSHGSPYFYDSHVPLAFFGLPFEAGVYHGRCEVVDIAPTLAALLGINAPAKASGRVLTEAIKNARSAR